LIITYISHNALTYSTEKKGGDCTMSLIERLRKKAKEQKSKSNFLNLQEIGNTIAMKLVKSEDKIDKKGNECVYLTLVTQVGQNVVQKFTPTAYDELADSMEKSGGEDSLKEHFHVYEKRKIGRAFFDRLYPTSEIAQPESKGKKGK